MRGLDVGIGVGDARGRGAEPVVQILLAADRRVDAGDSPVEAVERGFGKERSHLVHEHAAQLPVLIELDLHAIRDRADRPGRAPRLGVERGEHLVDAVCDALVAVGRARQSVADSRGGR